jgi:hypothetical protein
VGDGLVYFALPLTYKGRNENSFHLFMNSPFRKGIFWGLLITLIPFLAQAQVEGISIVSAENYYLDKDYRNALIGFEEYLQDVQFEKNVAYKAGICASRLGIGKKAIGHVLAARTAGVTDSYLPFWLGRAFHLDEQWDSAAKYLEQYLDVFPIDKSFKREADQYLRQIGIAKSMMNSSLQPYIIENMGNGINSIYSEFHPMLTYDGKMMVFTSRKRGYMEEKLLDDGEYKEKIFSSRKLPDGTWSKAIPIRLVEGRNKDLDYIAIQLLDNDSKLLLYKVQGNDARLYVSDYVDENWKLPYQIPIVPDPRFFSGDIFFSNDLKTVVFTTNGSTNKFQNDLFTSTYNDKTETWSEPVYLGKNIDTYKDEAAPFFPDPKTMIFSSKSDEGLGEFDLFKSVWDEEKKTWSKPVNLGFPYNTPNNDFYFFYQKNNPDVQYFSSTRGTTKGLSDIYKVTKTSLTEVAGTIKDETGTLLASSNLLFDDPENFQNVKVATDGQGKFKVQLVAGQTYQVHYKKAGVLLEGILKIPFPANPAELSGLNIQLAPKEISKEEKEAGFAPGE